jgi:8-oxo-dGTP pyrophosphatase MutT (NUDIX family)
LLAAKPHDRQQLLEPAMIHRVRAAGLIVEAQRVLLVRHRTPGTERDWWIPPGGGLKPEDAGVLDTARREIFEETGLTATVSRIGYVNEWRQASTGIHHVEFFVPVDSYTGDPSLRHVRQDEAEAEFIKELRWMERPQLDGLIVYPAWLRADWFWQDAAEGFPTTRYTGVEAEQ